MNGPENYREAERLIVGAEKAFQAGAEGRAFFNAQAAQVHATLALAAATATLDATEGPAGGSATGRTVEDWLGWDAVLNGGESRG